MPTRIRPATPDDAPAIGEVDPLSRGADVARATLVEDALHGRRDNLCLVAPAGEGPRLAGFAVLRHGHFFGRDFVDLLVVAPAARRQGVGSALLCAAVGAGVSERVFTSTNRSNVAMRALLAGQGWEISGSLGGLDEDDDEIVAWTGRGAAAALLVGLARGPKRLFHIALREDWDRARRAGEYRVSTIGHSLDEVGFVHASFAQQVAATAARHYAGVDAPLVLLVVDRSRLGAAVRVEPAPGSDEVYPHVYGPVPVAAVTEAVELRRDAAGRLVLPTL